MMAALKIMMKIDVLTIKSLIFIMATLILMTQTFKIMLETVMKMMRKVMKVMGGGSDVNQFQIQHTRDVRQNGARYLCLK